MKRAVKQSPSPAGGRCMTYELLLRNSAPAEERNLAIVVYNPEFAALQRRQLEVRLGGFLERMTAKARAREARSTNP